MASSSLAARALSPVAASMLRQENVGEQVPGFQRSPSGNRRFHGLELSHFFKAHTQKCLDLRVAFAVRNPFECFMDSLNCFRANRALALTISARG